MGVERGHPPALKGRDLTGSILRRVCAGKPGRGELSWAVPCDRQQRSVFGMAVTITGEAVASKALLSEPFVRGRRLLQRVDWDRPVETGRLSGWRRPNPKNQAAILAVRPSCGAAGRLAREKGSSWRRIGARENGLLLQRGLARGRAY